MVPIIHATGGVRPQILIADSYKSRAVILRGFLEELSTHLEILPATDGSTTLSVAGNQHIQLFIIDVFLRGSMTGFDLCRAIRSTDGHRETPIILMLSGHLIPEHDRGISAGADLMLHSPVVKEELWTMVVLLLESANTIQNADQILAIRNEPPRSIPADRAQIKHGNRELVEVWGKSWEGARTHSLDTTSKVSTIRG